MDTSSHLPNSTDERLDVFASVQYDKDVWDLVQKKYHQFEDLHKQLEEKQTDRRDLLKRLSGVNDDIAGLQEKLISLSGKEKIDQEFGHDLISQSVEEAEPVSADVPQAIEAPEFHSAEEPDPFVAASDNDSLDEKPTLAHESVMSWPGIAAQSVDEAEVPAVELSSTPEPQVEPLDEAPSTEAYQPVVADTEPEPAAMTFAQPITEEPVNEPAPIVEVAPVESPVAPSQEPVAAKVDAPSEVADLQHLFDSADQDRRQADSALKLVQLYDGKAEVFFAAMCRSHQQNGLTEDDARQEAIKDVQTMIATAKAHENAASKSDEPKKKNSSGNGMRRLFSH